MSFGTHSSLSLSWSCQLLGPEDARYLRPTLVVDLTDSPMPRKSCCSLGLLQSCYSSHAPAVKGTIRLPSYLSLPPSHLSLFSAYSGLGLGFMWVVPGQAGSTGFSFLDWVQISGGGSEVRLTLGLTMAPYPRR